MSTIGAEKARAKREDETRKTVSGKTITAHAIVEIPARAEPDGTPITGGLAAFEFEIPEDVVHARMKAKTAASHPWECVAWITNRLELRFHKGGKG